MTKEKIKFSDSLYLKWNWREVAFQINTGKAYQHKQDLVSLFGNAYSYIELKFEPFFERSGEVPMKELEDLVFEFRQSFPKDGRVVGVNYFDDLIRQLISKHNKHKKGGEKSKRKPDMEKINQVKIFLREHPVSSPTPQKIFNTLEGSQLVCSLSWLKKHIKEITS